MSHSHADPPITIASLRESIDSRARVVHHREEAERIVKAGLARGLTPRQALQQARSPILAGTRALRARRAELASVSARG